MDLRPADVLLAWWSVQRAGAPARVHVETRVQPFTSGAALLRWCDVPNPWYGAVSGRLKWSTAAADGREINCGGMPPGSRFGKGTLRRGPPSPADVIAPRPSVAAVMPRDRFDGLCRTQIAVSHVLIQQLTERTCGFMEGWIANRMLDADGLVKRAPVWHFQPRRNPHGPRHLAVSQDEVTNLAGVPRPRCNRALRQLEETGVLTLEDAGWTVADPEGLCRGAPRGRWRPGCRAARHRMPRRAACLLI